jgi:hypothetical protein
LVIKVSGSSLGDAIVRIPFRDIRLSPCSLGLSATSQQYFSLTINQPPATSQQYFSLRTNQHQPSATSQTNRLFLFWERSIFFPCNPLFFSALSILSVANLNLLEYCDSFYHFYTALTLA